MQFILELDATDSGVGAVLSQRSESECKLHACAFFSRQLSPAEQNYDVGNWELLAIKLALEEWRHWLEGAKRLEGFHFVTSIHCHSLWWCGWGGSGLCRTAMGTEHLLSRYIWYSLVQLVWNWPAGLSSIVPLSSWEILLVSCWCCCVPSIPLFMCAVLSIQLSCSQSKQCTDLYVKPCSLEWHFCQS